MLRPLGYGVTKEPGKADVSEDALTCGHCNFIEFVPPGIVVQPPRCRLCYCYLCKRCEQHPLVYNDLTGRMEDMPCDPIERKLERMEARGRLLRAVG